MPSLDALQKARDKHQCLCFLRSGLRYVRHTSVPRVQKLTAIVGDDDFVNAAYYYNEDVLYGSELIRITPKFLVP